MEHSDRGRYVTDQVSVWICNDSEYITKARDAWRNGFLEAYLTRVIREARPYSSPWHVGQELAPNDYNRIDWHSVADDLKEEVTAVRAREQLDAYRANRCHVEDFQQTVASMDPKMRQALLNDLGVDEVESLLEVSFLSGDTVYRDQVVNRLCEIDPARGAGPRRAAAERDKQGGESS